MSRDFVLVNVADHLLHGVQAIAGLQCGLVGLLGTITGLGGMLVSFIRFGRSLANAFLRPGINVFNLLRVGGGKIVELIYPVANRTELMLHVLLASKGVQLSPESLTHVRLEWLPRTHVLI